MPIAAALAVAGIAGGITVNLLAVRISDADRAAIVAWERDVTALVAPARALSVDLERFSQDPVASSGQIQAAREALDEVRRELPTVPTPKILFRATELLTMWMFEAQDALVLAERARNQDRTLTASERAALAESLLTADEHFHDARDALVRLRCRARLERCDQTSLPV